MSWTRAVWFEYEKDGSVVEFEETIPSNWLKDNTVYWPNRNVELSIKNMSDPNDNWSQFKLKYVKIADDDRSVCIEYGDNVTAGESGNGEMTLKNPIKGNPSSKKTKHIQHAKSIAMPVPPMPVQSPVPPIQNQIQIPKIKMKTSKKRSSNHSATNRQDADIPLKKKRKEPYQNESTGTHLPSSFPSLPGCNITSSPRPNSTSSSASYPGCYSALLQSTSSPRPPKSNNSSPRPPKPNNGSFVSESENSFTDVSAVIPHSQKSYNRRDSASARNSELRSSSYEDNGFQHIVLRHLAEITLKLNDLNKKLDALNSSAVGDKNCGLPQQFKEVKDFCNFDKKLGADKKDFKKFVKQLSSIGGNSGQKCVTNMVNRMMSKLLQSKFNLAGSKGKATVKLPIQDLNIYRAIIEATKRLDVKATDSETRSFIALTLKNAPYCLNGGKRKMQENLEENLSEEEQDEDESVNDRDGDVELSESSAVESDNGE